MRRARDCASRLVPLVAGLLVTVLTLTARPAAAAEEQGMARVGPGVWRPLVPPSPEEREVRVRAFQLDRTPVTNAQFLAFLRTHPRWQRGRVPRLFADEAYLSHWRGPLEPGPGAEAQAPVVRVSWFAAKAYCEARGARLPTEAEWELAAQASETERDASRDPAFRERILRWYTEPATERLPRVGQGRPNVWGVSDLHGLVWEWVLDFGNTLVGGDSREGGNPDKVRFCGAGAESADDKGDYANFMRVAFRSALQATYTTPSLGFRCAKDVEGGRR